MYNDYPLIWKAVWLYIETNSQIRDHVARLDDFLRSLLTCFHDSMIKVMNYRIHFHFCEKLHLVPVKIKPWPCVFLSIMYLSIFFLFFCLFYLLSYYNCILLWKKYRMLPLLGASLHNSNNTTNIAPEHKTTLIKYCYQEVEYVLPREKNILWLKYLKPCCPEVDCSWQCALQQYCSVTN